GRVVLPGRHRCLWATELLPMPPGRRGPPPRAHSRPEPSWSRQRHTGVTASPGPGTHWPSRPESCRPPQPTPLPPALPPALPPPALSKPTSSPPPTAGEPAQAQEHHRHHQGQQPQPLRREGGGGWWMGGLRRVLVEAARGCHCGQNLCPAGRRRWPESCLGWTGRVPGASGSAEQATLKTLRAPPASRTHARSRGPAGWLPAPTSLSPERPCPEGAGTQQKVGPLRWPGIEPGSTAWKAAMLTTIPPTLHSPGGRHTPAPGSPQHTLAAAAASLPRRPSAGGSAPPPAPPAATRRPQRASATRSPGSTGPTAPGRRPRRLAALRPFAPRRGPPTPPPSPPAGNAGHAASSTQLAKALLHRALGEATSHDDKGTRDPPACTRRGAVTSRAAWPSRAYEPTQAATGGRCVGEWPGRQIRLWSGKAVGSPRRPSPRRGDRAPADDKGLRLERCSGRGGRRELGRAPPLAALAPRPKTAGGDEGPSGAWRQDRQRPRPPKRAGILTTILTRTAATVLPPGRPRALGLPAHASPCPARAAGHHGSRPNRAPNQPPRSQRQPATPTGTRTPGALDPPQRAPPLASNAGVPPGEGGARRQAGLRGHGGRAPAGVGPGEARARRGRPAEGPGGSAAPAAAEPGASAGRRAPAPSTPTPDGRLPACLPACLAWRPARPAKGAGARAASGPSQASGHAPSQPRRAPPRPRPRRSTQPRGGWQALLPSPALRLLPGERPTRPRSLASTAARASSPARPAPRPPRSPRRPVCAPQPQRGGRAPALPARGVPRALDPSPPCVLGRAAPACRPPGTRATQPSCWPAHTGLPCTSPSREGCSAGEGAEALRARPAHPPAPGPRPRPRRHGDRSRGKPLPRPEPSPPWRAPCLSAGSPRARSRSAKGPLLTTTTPSEPDPGARSARAQEPGSHAFGSLGLSAVLRMGWGGGGGAVAEALGGVALPRSRFPHRPSPASLPPPALARPTPARPESQPARGTLGRDPAVA
ncbi:hypothetical protein CapIbe_003220, partial [Capra ibex]